MMLLMFCGSCTQQVMLVLLCSARLLALEEQYRKEKEEADLIFEQQRQVIFTA